MKLSGELISSATGSTLSVSKEFSSDGLTLLDDRFDYGEIRFLTLGMLNGRVVAVSHTETDEVTRIISVRKASKDEEEIYDKESRDWRD